MTKKSSPRTLPELREAENLTEEEFVKQVVSPMWKRGKGKTLRQIAAEIIASYETVRQLLMKYGEYE